MIHILHYYYYYSLRLTVKMHRLIFPVMTCIIIDVREWLATFPFPPIPISSFPFPWCLGFNSHSCPISKIYSHSCLNNERHLAYHWIIKRRYVFKMHKFNCLSFKLSTQNLVLSVSYCVQHTMSQCHILHLYLVDRSMGILAHVKSSHSHCHVYSSPSHFWHICVPIPMGNPFPCTSLLVICIGL